MTGGPVNASARPFSVTYAWRQLQRALGTRGDGAADDASPAFAEAASEEPEGRQ